VRGTAARAVAGLRDEAGQPIIDLLTEALTDKESWFVGGSRASSLTAAPSAGASGTRRGSPWRL